MWLDFFASTRDWRHGATSKLSFRSRQSRPPASPLLFVSSLCGCTSRSFTNPLLSGSRAPTNICYPLDPFPPKRRSATLRSRRQNFSTTSFPFACETLVEKRHWAPSIASRSARPPHEPRLRYKKVSVSFESAPAVRPPPVVSTQSAPIHLEHPDFETPHTYTSHGRLR